MSSVKWESMKHLIGQPLRAERIPTTDHLPDGVVKIVEDYENTVLVDMEYIAFSWWGNIPPRHIRQNVSKASIYCGDVILKVLSSGERVRASVKGVGA